jgi:arylsulfatase A-like enzyme
MNKNKHLPMKIIKTLYANISYSSFGLFAATIFASFFYVFMEWLFIITKPSYMTVSTFFEKINIFLFTGSILSGICLLVLTPVWITKTFVSSNKYIKITNIIAIFIPTIILTSLSLMLIDNFTYTVFKLGIINSSGITRLFYTVLFVALGVIIYYQVLRLIHMIDRKMTKNLQRTRMILVSICVVILIISTIPFIAGSNIKSLHIVNDNNQNIGRKPDIFLITADSIDASHMSVYGYERDTTPFLKELSNDSLLAVNAFSNAQGTTGSLTSILTGKYPQDTRVLYAPDILRGENSYQHLPGVLRAYGYYSVQISFNYYADADDLNFLSGFDEANGQFANESKILSRIKELIPTNYAYFIYDLGNRLVNRISHILFIKKMENPYSQVTEALQSYDDQKKITTIISMIDESKQPLFVHMHWMGTHGPLYHPGNRVFSLGQDIDQQGQYNIDFYDDSILEFDQGVAALWDALEERNLLDNALIVISSDHSQKWTISQLPLMIRFPNSEYKKIISENVQYLDIAPTILDYLDISKPSWMSGKSLLSNIDAFRPIFLSTVVAKTKIDEKIGLIIHQGNTPPFFQFGKIAVIVCDTWFELNLSTLQMRTGKFNKYPISCDSAQKINEDEALSMIINHLEIYHFDISSLKQLELNK